MSDSKVVVATNASLASLKADGHFNDWQFPHIKLAKRYITDEYFRKRKLLRLDDGRLLSEVFKEHAGKPWIAFMYTESPYWPDTLGYLYLYNSRLEYNLFFLDDLVPGGREDTDFEGEWLFLFL